KVDVIAQNIETLERLNHPERDPLAGYFQTLNFLKYVKQKSPNVLTKTSIMVGLGETDEELYKTIDDARIVGVDIITL
ncbi:lipoyl synthase, partial [Francisella tularensis subsp. holarctica]|nr:lipoyl synthase [Francisella tularensis subsp. holarctica]